MDINYEIVFDMMLDEDFSELSIPEILEILEFSEVE